MRMQNECIAKAEGNQLYTTELIWQKKKNRCFCEGGVHPMQKQVLTYLLSITYIGCTPPYRKNS